ncbi:MAG: hypothetical protein JWQ21_2118 [Herminiimonas sp.]|nr:hypothetical protein [Herminiimonas sp.]
MTDVRLAIRFDIEMEAFHRAIRRLGASLQIFPEFFRIASPLGGPDLSFCQTNPTAESEKRRC